MADLFPVAMKPTKTLETVACHRCGCQEVEVHMIVPANRPTTVDPREGDWAMDAIWCPTCEDELYDWCNLIDGVCTRHGDIPFPHPE